ncbi:MAG: T9SS type A sorting domain-containing protein, partial [Bacteroidia bacterium]
QFDFRQVYASVLQDWFELSPEEVNAAMGGKTFNTLPIFKSNPAGLEDYLDLVSRISISEPYPNPAIEACKVRISSDGGQVELKLFDPLGRELRVLLDERVVPGEQEIEVDLRGLRPGNYVLQLAQGPNRQSRIISKR